MIRMPGIRPLSPLMAEAYKATGLPAAEARRRLAELADAATDATERYSILMLMESAEMDRIARRASGEERTRKRSRRKR